MARILLVNPPSPERLGSPLLGQQYVAAALLRAGHDVRVVDAASSHASASAAEIRRVAEDFQPDMVGVGLFTRWVWHAYAVIRELRDMPCLKVAGGAHTTVRPEETLAQGFDVAVVGEAEITAPLFAVAGDDRSRWAEIPGLVFRDGAGAVRRTPAAGFVSDLDELAWPLDAQPLYEGAWYGREGAAPAPGGMLTSRGCPARCTFCANYVTGRGFRFRSAEDVVAELNAHYEQFGALYFPFWDDALTANLKRLRALCEAIQSGCRFPLQWGAITRANLVKPDLLRLMRDAGCIHVNFGVESGDDDILRQIKKGVATKHVVQALEWAKELGLRTAANFMLGFPQETPEALERTLRFMQRIAPTVDTFSTLGVAVPFPGTELYDKFHEQYGFTDWWLEESYSHYEAAPPVSDFANYYRHYIDDNNLELDFFRYSPDMRNMIRECLRYKAEHNLVGMGLLQPA